MTSKVNWELAPAEAQFYSAGNFRYHDKHVNNEYWWEERWYDARYETLEEHKYYSDFEMRPTLDDSNCNTYNPDETPDYDEWDNRELGAEEDFVKVADNQEELVELLDKSVKTSIQFLDEVKVIQEERAAEYEQDGGERSFAKITTVFNTYTGKNLQPSDIALILEILKNVRFYSQDGYHKDSVIDKISYGSLWAELVTQERGGK